MRVLSDVPTQLMASIAEQFLKPLWFTADAVAAIARGESAVFYEDEALSVRVDLKATPRTTALVLTAKGGKVYRLIALLRPAFPPHEAYLDAEQRMIFLVKTSAARHPDGTVQIYGAEPGVMIFTLATFQQALQADRTLIDNGDVMEGFHIAELRDGDWRHVDRAIPLKHELLRELKFE